MGGTKQRLRGSADVLGEASSPPEAHEEYLQQEIYITCISLGRRVVFVFYRVRCLSSGVNARGNYHMISCLLVGTSYRGLCL